MTSLLHLVMLFKPIKSTLMQSYLLFSPPSNTFLHLPCSSACSAPPQAGHPNHGTLNTLVGFSLLSSACLGISRITCCGQGHCASWSTARAAPHHLQPHPAPSQVVWQHRSSWMEFPEGSRNHHSHGNWLLQNPARIPHTTPPETPKHSSVTLGKTTSTWASSHWPMFLNPYLNTHFKPATAQPTLPLLERACRCYITTSSQGITAARVQNQLSALKTQAIQRNDSNMKNGSGGNTRGNIKGCNCTITALQG